jgi:hypothetical protein
MTGFKGINSNGNTGGALWKDDGVEHIDGNIHTLDTEAEKKKLQEEEAARAAEIADAKAHSDPLFYCTHHLSACASFFDTLHATGLKKRAASKKCKAEEVSMPHPPPNL